MYAPLSRPVPGKKEPDMVNSPPHYTQVVLSNGARVECVEIIEALDLPYHLACVFKYIWRLNDKGSRLENLRKARWYLNRWIMIVENSK